MIVSTSWDSDRQEEGGTVPLYMLWNVPSRCHFGINCQNILIVGVDLPKSKFQVDPTKKWTSVLDSALEVMPKYKILGQQEL